MGAIWITRQPAPSTQMDGLRVNRDLRPIVAPGLQAGCLALTMLEGRKKERKYGRKQPQGQSGLSSCVPRVFAGELRKVGVATQTAYYGTEIPLVSRLARLKWACERNQEQRKACDQTLRRRSSVQHD